ncbi:unnamed protein product, partial [Allacma fusca]
MELNIRQIFQRDDTLVQVEFLVIQEENKMYFRIILTVFTGVYSARCAPVISFVELNPELGPHLEGDLMENPNDVLKSEIFREKGQWPNRTVPFSVTSEFSARELSLIGLAMLEIENKTCIKFKPGSSGDFVLYTKSMGNSCGANVGRIGGKQLINLASPCFLVGHGTAMHETLHALGFVHEQSRGDRDSFVAIVWDKILNSAKGNFQKSNSGNEKYGTYDYGSIMHYPKTAFAKKR